MSTNDPTLNMNLLLEQIEISIELTEKNARHMNDREVATGMTGVQRSILKLVKKEMQPSESSIRVLTDVEDNQEEVK